jgi:hypothetical protein
MESFMMNLMSGTQTLTIRSVHEISIHGSVYYQIEYVRQGSDTAEALRINPEAFYHNPRPGDVVEVRFVMGNIMGATRLSSAES